MNMAKKAPIEWPSTEVTFRCPTRVLDKIDILADAMDTTRNKALIKLLDTALEEG